MIAAGTKIRVKEGAAIVALYGLQVGDEIVVCERPEGWDVQDIWISIEGNKHIKFEESWLFCEVLCIATNEQEFNKDFEVVSEASE